MTRIDDLDQVLTLARSGLASSAATRERVLGGLGRQFPELAASRGPLAMDTPPAAPPRFWHLLRATGVRGLGVGALLLGAGFAAGVAARDTLLAQRVGSAPLNLPSNTTPLPVQAPEPAPPEAAAPSATSVATSAPEPPRASAPKAVPKAAASERGSHDLERELAALRRAERALRNGNPALALALLDELDNASPASPLLEERNATRLLALCQSGAPGAVRDAERFLAAHPASVYGVRLERSCRSTNGGNGSSSVGH